MAQELLDVLVTTFWMVLGIALIFGIFLAVSALVYVVWNFLNNKQEQLRGFASLKTVTFGDESSVTANRVASVSGVITVFLIWMIATGSSLLPVKILPVPFVGDTQFEYTATNAAGAVSVTVEPVELIAVPNKEAELRITVRGSTSCVPPV